MQKLLKWIDNHILEYLSFALLIFIPLYPKIPIADLIPGYIVRLRPDDLLVAAAFAVWVVWLLRRKVTLRGNPLAIPMLLYIAIGLISSVAAIFITKTVPFSTVHVEKLIFNWARRIEYFSVFFIFYSSLKSFAQVKKYVYLTAVVLFAVSLYGFGQKYLYFPAFSTMNREFSKGVRLYLTEHARVLSTFGGHYDLAAYLMVLLSLFIPLAFMLKKFVIKASLLAVSLAGFWLLILTVSRTSFVAYIVAITIAFFMLMYKKGWIWALSRWFIVIALSLGIMLSFGDLSDRFAHILKLDGLKNSLGLLKPLKSAPPAGAGVAYLDVGTKSDAQPTTQKPSGSITNIQAPSDVYSNVPEFGTGTGVPATLAARPRVYSQTAVEYDLSTGIRLDYTWPQAIKGFERNILLGSGYSTLTKKNIEDFTEAESTDNDFLRALGETGLLGFLSFFGITGYVLYLSIKSFKKVSDPFAQAVIAGLVAGIFGLLVNAVYIDVFEASKDAYIYWMMAAVLLATIKLAPKLESR